MRRDCLGRQKMTEHEKGLQRESTAYTNQPNAAPVTTPRLTGGGNEAATAANADGGGALACSGECDMLMPSRL